MSILKEIKESVIDGNPEKVKECVKEALDQGIETNKVLNEGLIAGMNIVGTRFRNEDCHVPEVLAAGVAMQTGSAVIKPYLEKEGIQEKATLLIGTVKDDLHDIGKNLVIMLFEGAGYKVIDLGIDVSTEKFIEAVEKHQPQIVGISALLTTTMNQMKDTVKQLKPLNDSITILVGGAPVTEEFANEIGAEYAPDAASAVEKADKFIAS